MTKTREELKSVLSEQQKEIEQYLIEQGLVSRTQKDFFLSLLKTKPVKVIIGVRRCGKSTFAAQLIRQNGSFAYVNFDDERLYGLKSSDLNSVFEVLCEFNEKPDFFLFDEIQNVLGWELFVNRLHRKGLNLAVTGSNAHLLSKELATHLTGRHLTLELFPFSFREFCHFNQINIESKTYSHLTTEERAKLYRLLSRYFEAGGFPEVAQGVPAGHYLRELFDKIISRDIIQRYQIRSNVVLKELALFLISHFSSKITFQRIVRELGFSSVNTAKKYLGYLEETFLIQTVKPFSFKMKEILKLPQKVYAIDLGMIEAILPKVTEDFGRKLENMVFLELRRRGLEIFYYQSEKHEVDFLIRQGRTVTELIQVCYQMKESKTREREVNALLEAARKVQCQNLTLVTWETEETIHEQGLTIQVVPVLKFLTG